ncbi:deoxyribodipyrimidine photo-lyase [Chitinophaga costaii]|uniref:Deoxyribodipyrimidine photo-lyase n=1 Tax=Chitinophaga costaii TaxID=1335309 RepID=A0A1C4BV31_9BACT|nr:deoxyribodipyrimidine photo-lyase [Chitinophaga costaii]PUZ27456.1 deoxyribodipyrimidine photo-lyase [Chitinophaga costaii]SCC10761.1 deoxyribodipyrimidine photo-lyase [Chitinophaga costaii]
MSDKICLCWMRRDLRLEDNAALYHALKSGFPVVPVFIFDTNILDDLEDKRDRRITFIYTTLENMQAQLIKKGSGLDVFYGTPQQAFDHYLTRYDVQAVFANQDYEPYAIARDAAISKHLQEKNIALHFYKDQVIFEQSEVMKDNGEPYTVFTPYSRKWKSLLTNFALKNYPCDKYASSFFQQAPPALPSYQQLGFIETDKHFPGSKPADAIIQHYDKTRDYPALDQGTSRLGVHLRFGTISIRTLARKALQLNETYLNELIWREFYQMILWHFPKVVTESFKAQYDNISWRNNTAEFEKWCKGETGYPIVDAGMRQLNTTGFMHNRVRMITASFLTKHLLIDWRWGEAYFGVKLLDYDLAANNGGWQWAAGSGCDAAPYFRIFNPYLQTTRFDKELKYIRHWVPELDTLQYPPPIVIHEAARKRALAVYEAGIKP